MIIAVNYSSMIKMMLVMSSEKKRLSSIFERLRPGLVSLYDRYDSDNKKESWALNDDL